MACSLAWCLHSESPPAQDQSQRIRTNGSQTDVSSSIKSPYESLALHHLLLKMKYSVSCAANSFMTTSMGAKVPTMCHDPKPLDQEKKTLPYQSSKANICQLQMLGTSKCLRVMEKQLLRLVSLVGLHLPCTNFKWKNNNSMFGQIINA